MVLSNNDGCVISRSIEAKRLGVEMGAPYFQIRDLLAERGVSVFSSNYALYHDMSSRIEQVLETFSGAVERYSIDEAFLGLQADPWAPDEPQRLSATARAIRQRVWDVTRVPVRVSIAETKTLAKAASELARRLPEQSACLWRHPHRDRWLSSLRVRDVWGVGPRWARRLEADGAGTAAELAALADDHIRRRYNVVLLRTALELRGISCLPLGEAPPPRQSLVRSRMFGTPLADAAPIGRAIAMHAAAAAARLRQDGLAAEAIEAFVTTGNRPPRWRGRAATVLPTATSDTLALVRTARQLVAPALRGARPGTRFKKAGVILTGIVPVGQRQADLFRRPTAEQPALMAALDAATRRFGRGAVVVAAQGTPDDLRDIHAGGGQTAWGMRRAHLSPRYTTVWDEIPEARL